jgi:predicted TIM-barrel fold metal-dependent hydrolase
MRTIALEEHYASPAFVLGPGRDFGKYSQFTAKVIGQLRDVDERRIAEMDAAGLDMQVLSLVSPGVEQLDAAASVKIAQESNDFLAEAVRRHPSRLAGFASIPTPAPEQAADELERAVRECGLKGALINGHTRGRYLDDEVFWPILQRAEELGVPIYIHPTLPPEPVIRTYYAGNHPPEATARLAGGGYGWHIETAVHVLRIITSGALDRYPRLQLVIGHLGETLPFMLPRLETMVSNEATKLPRPISAYLRENVYYTISGFNFVPTFLDTLLEVGADRIIFSTDYPFSPTEEAMAFLEHLPASTVEREKIAHGNAERLLRL